LKITLVQTELEWENAPANLKRFNKILQGIGKNKTDIILLPEMFTTGFTMNAKQLAERMDGESVQWMRELAAKKNAVVCGSLVIEDKKKFYNRLVWMRPDGTYEYYDKRHLFRMANEHLTYSSGKKKLIVEWKGWKICPLVCYDLRFPVWSRNTGDYDLLLYVANWPERRRYAWSQLLIARAIENQCFVAGLNRVGVDGKNISYTGDSVVLDPFGEKSSRIKPAKVQVETVKLDPKVLLNARKNFPVMMDKDRFRIL
jgi:omega-amidase